MRDLVYSGKWRRLTFTVRNIQGCHGVAQLTPQNGILLLQLVVPPHQFETTTPRLSLTAQFCNASFKILDMLFGPLANRALSFPVIRPFSLQLGRRQCCHATSSGSRLALLARRRVHGVRKVLMMMM